ncbi:hypothetical protein AB4K20DRAFT_1967637 [Rhizopus microsporus]|uniref:Uncharacterized protein n=1 Tax=Rhizopus microsporus TaxID=58291 RepID=A0A1X0SBN1_RHIZD|nr:hypothetical protein BCV71DRAFT_260893 [Rhizopus microsporus]
MQDLKAPEPDVQAEQALSQQPSSTVSVEHFGRFLQARSQQSTVFSPSFSVLQQQRADQKLIQDLRAKFGEDAVFVIGNWSAPHARYHEPIRGLGFRRLLKKHGLQAFLIDEYKTSRCCPTCHNESLHTFRRVPNPRPHQRERYPTVVCHDASIHTVGPPWQHQRDIAYGTVMLLLASTTCTSFVGFDKMTWLLIGFAELLLLLQDVEEEWTIRSNQELEYP